MCCYVIFRLPIVFAFRTNATRLSPEATLECFSSKMMLFNATSPANPQQVSWTQSCLLSHSMWNTEKVEMKWNVGEFDRNQIIFYLLGSSSIQFNSKLFIVPIRYSLTQSTLQYTIIVQRKKGKANRSLFYKPNSLDRIYLETRIIN